MEMRKDRVRHGQIHCQRSSSLRPTQHGCGLVLVDKMANVPNTEELRTKSKVVKKANHGGKQHSIRACVPNRRERSKGTKYPMLGALPNGARRILELYKKGADWHKVKEDKLEQVARILAEMERIVSEALGVSDDSKEEEEAGRKRRTDWNMTSDSRNFEDSVV